ncbi:MAG: hypothetical protein ABSA14_07390 [Acidimicrobiales bacterium]|jgi:hypothetical protein
MGNLDRSGIRRAAKLLAKAASTDSDDEAIALTLRSYSLLADAINAYDLACAGTRRHERRLLRDRRSGIRGSAEPSGKVPNPDQDTAVNGYVRLGNGGVRAEGSVDFSL